MCGLLEWLDVSGLGSGDDCEEIGVMGGSKVDCVESEGGRVEQVTVVVWK